jgi:1-acyl-sn-glycerol-3-phosphate acyltransferase
MAQVIQIDRVRRRPARCQAITTAGRQCRNAALESGFCRVHLPPAPADRIGPVDAQRIQDAIAFLGRRLTGQYEIDEFGFDPELTETLVAPLFRPLHRAYWRVEWRGLENLPAEGSALLVGNHSGTLPVDALVLKFGLLDMHPAHRHVRLLAADLVFRLPILGALARKTGSTLACDEDAIRLLDSGEVVGVFPEGYKGVGKGYKNRYRLQRFGRGGFVEIALRTGAPIIPVAIVGSEEIYPMIGNWKLAARIGGFPYFPITPFFPWLGPLGAIPLPSKWIIRLGEPIDTTQFGKDAWKDAMLVFELTDRVRDEVQQMLYKNLMERRSVFF